MRQHAANAAYLRSRYKIVFVLWNVFRNPNGVLTHGAKRVCQLFAAVDAHGITSLWIVRSTRADCLFRCMVLPRRHAPSSFFLARRRLYRLLHWLGRRPTGYTPRAA